MPIYDLKCPQCNTEKEVFPRSFSSKVDSECPNCHAEMEILCGAATIIYKGAGFYTTEARGITGRKRKPNIKVGTISDLPPEERAKYEQVVFVRVWFKDIICLVCDSDANVSSPVLMVGIHLDNSCGGCNVWNKLLQNVLDRQ